MMFTTRKELMELVIDTYNKNLLRYKYSFKSWDFPRCVNLYNDSRTAKRAAQKNNNDFASVIATALEK